MGRENVVFPQDSQMPTDSQYFLILFLFQIYLFIMHSAFNHTWNFIDNLVETVLNLQEFSDRNKSMIL